VPASVDGLLDFHFYDYVFQREVPQDGYTNPAGTQWVRNNREQPRDGLPSPKKWRMTNAKTGGRPLKLALVTKV